MILSHLEDLPPILSIKAQAEKARFCSFIQNTHGHMRYKLIAAYCKRYNEVPHLS